MVFFEPLQDDIWERQKTFTEEKKEFQKAFEASLRGNDEEEGGTATKEVFQKEFDDAWNEIYTHNADLGEPDTEHHYEGCTKDEIIYCANNIKETCTRHIYALDKKVNNFKAC